MIIQPNTDVQKAHLLSEINNFLSENNLMEIKDFHQIKWEDWLDLSAVAMQKGNLALSQLMKNNGLDIRQGCTFI